MATTGDNNNHWQQEIERQNGVIDVLLTKTRQQEEALNQYRKLWEALPHIPALTKILADDSKKLFDWLGNFIVCNDEKLLPDQKKIFSQIFSEDAFLNKINSNRKSVGTSTEKITGSKEIFCPSIEKMDGQNILLDTIANKISSNKKSVGASAEKIIGSKEMFCPSIKKMDGQNISLDTIANKLYGDNEKKTTNSQPANCNHNNSDAFVKNTGNPANKSLQNQLAIHAFNEKEEAAASSATSPNNPAAGSAIKKERIINSSILEDLIGRVIVRSNNDGLRSAADILKRLAHSSQQSMKQLQSLTGLSQSGMGKRLTSLKRYGLIKRGANRQLLLTDKAMEMVERASL